MARISSLLLRNTTMLFLVLVFVVTPSWGNPLAIVYDDDGSSSSGNILDLIVFTVLAIVGMLLWAGNIVFEGKGKPSTFWWVVGGLGALMLLLEKTFFTVFGVALLLFCSVMQVMYNNEVRRKQRSTAIHAEEITSNQHAKQNAIRSNRLELEDKRQKRLSKNIERSKNHANKQAATNVATRLAADTSAAIRANRQLKSGTGLVLEAGSAPAERTEMLGITNITARETQRAVACKNFLEPKGYDFVQKFTEWIVVEPSGDVVRFSSIEELEDYTDSL